MNRLAAVLAALLLLCLGAPAIASAQFGPNAPSPLLQQDDSNAAPFDEDEGLSTLQLVLIFGGAAIAVGLVAWVIVRDARRKAAPGRSGSKAGSGSGSRPAATLETSPKSSAAKAAREREREKARKRARAKAARNQRKHNRPR